MKLVRFYPDGIVSGRGERLPLLAAIDRVHPSSLVLYDRDVAEHLQSEVMMVHRSTRVHGHLCTTSYGEILCRPTGRGGWMPVWRLIETQFLPLQWLEVRDCRGVLSTRYDEFYGSTGRDT